MSTHHAITRSTGRRLTLGLLAALLLFALAPTDALAIPRALRPGTRPWMFDFSIGGGINVVDAPSQFKMQQRLYYHFSGRTEGPALGLYTAESFGNNIFVFQVGPHFVYDIQPSRSLGLLISPFIGMGYSIAAVSRDRAFFGGRSTTAHFLDINFGAAVKLIINNRGFVFFQPFSFDMFIGEDFAARYDIQFGGGVTF